jgi:hypothetical protein
MRRSLSTLVAYSLPPMEGSHVQDAEQELTNLPSPDLRLVHLHLPPMDPDDPLNASFQLALLHGLDYFHLPRDRVS